MSVLLQHFTQKQGCGTIVGWHSTSCLESDGIFIYFEDARGKYFFWKSQSGNILCRNLLHATTASVCAVSSRTTAQVCLPL